MNIAFDFRSTFAIRNTLDEPAQEETLLGRGQMTAEIIFCKFRKPRHIKEFTKSNPPKDISKLPAAARKTCAWACSATSVALTVENFR
jgi:hypothetical protein